MFALNQRCQIKPWELTGGIIYKEDLVYLLYCNGQFNTYQDRWQGQQQSSGSLIERMKERKQQHGNPS